MILLAALAGAAIAGGLVLGFAGLRGRAPVPGTPPGLTAGLTLSRATRQRALIGLLAGLAVFVLTGWPVGALAALAAVVFLPKLGLTSGQRHRTAMLEGLEQWIRRLADMVTASRGLEDALEASARSAPAAVAGPVTRLATRLAARSNTEAALREFAAEIDDPAGDRIAAAHIIATGRRGGGARDVLVALATLLARDVAARREIEAERAQHRTTVRWIGIFVLGFTVFSVLNRSYSAPFGTVAGQVVLACVAALYAGGLFWLNQLGSVPAPGRFLDDTVPGTPVTRPAPLPPGAPAHSAGAESGRPW
jgi:Flp pilus assembly protein TadB